jgi:chromosome segregation ATPase
MNFYDLFEFKDTKGEHTKKKGSEDHQDVTIADPKAALALKQARNKYTYADSDLEAFIKMTQDKEEEEEQEIDDLDAAVEKNKEVISDLKAKEAEAETHIDTLEKENTASKKRIAQLKAENEVQTNRISMLSIKEKEYEEWAERVGVKLADLETRTDAALKRLDIAMDAKTEIPTLPKRADTEFSRSTAMDRAFKFDD